MGRFEHWARWAVSCGLCVACGGESSAGDSDKGASSLGGTAGASGNAGASHGGSAGTGGSASPARGGTAGTDTSRGGTAGTDTSRGGTAGTGDDAGSSHAGMDPVGGEGGDAGDTGNASNEPEPVRIIRGAPEDEFWDLTIRGEALDEYDGKLVSVRMGWPDRPPERLVSGGARIENGTFELVLPAAWESSLFKHKLVLIDVNGDRACDTSIDRLFADARASYTAELVVNLGPTAGMFDMFESDDSYYCEWFNGDWPLE